MKTIGIIAAVALTASVLVADGALAYKKCVACHGVTGEYKALGKSLIINKMTPDEIVVSLNGYKTDTYGGPLKGLMKGQVINFTDEEIQQVADYIGKK